AARGATYEAQLATLGARVAPDIVLLLADPGGSRRSTDEVLRHELSHVALHLVMEEAYISAPLWLDEGLAMYAEGEADKQDRRLLASAISNDALMSLRSLTSFPGSAEEVPLAYAESRDIVAYLLDTYGQDQFRRFLAALGSGDLTVDEALEVAYGLDQDSTYQAYRAAKGLGPAVPPPPEPTVGHGGGPLCAAALMPLAAAVAVLGRRRRGHGMALRPSASAEDR
ncbi:MAG: peptidase MA family metallohydrolase, partial [Anaerolineae bacterium]